MTGTINLLWNLSAQEILNLVDYAKDYDLKVTNHYVKLPATAENYRELLKEHTYDMISESVTFMSYVSNFKAVRDASHEAANKFSQYGIEQYMREDVFEWFLSLKANAEEMSKLTSEETRLLERGIARRRRAGLGLPADKKSKLEDLRKRISNLCLDYSKLVQDADIELYFSKEDLAGVPASTIASMKINAEGQYIVRPTEYPHLVPIAKYCSVVETRKAVLKAKNSVAFPENVDRMNEIISLRANLAHLLGFEDSASLSLVENLLNTPEQVFKFEDEMISVLKPLAKRELATLNQLIGNDDEAFLDPWNVSYYQNVVEERDYSIDQDTIKQYLQLDNILNFMKALISTCCHLEVEDVSSKTVSPPETPRSTEELLKLIQSGSIEEDGTVLKWSDDVFVWKLTDKKDGSVNYLYLDLFPRPQTYSHACCCSLQPWSKYNPSAVVALICNFPAPSGEYPSLLSHDDLTTLFHEMGHGLHALCSRTQHTNSASLSAVEFDYVESPSQSNEGWCWLRGALKLMSKHWKTGEQLPDEVIDKLVKSKQANAGLIELRQCFFSTYDITIHTKQSPESVDIIYSNLRKELTHTNDETGSGSANFSHLVGGYDSGYYSYMFSRVTAEDIFETIVERSGGDIITDDLQEYVSHFADVMEHYYRDMIRVGGTVPAKDMVKNFLGREVSSRALLKSFGVN